MGLPDQVKGFINNVVAGAVWDGIKQLWGPVVLAAIVAVWEKAKHGSLDWFAIVGMFFLASLLVFLYFRKPSPEATPQQWKPAWKKLQWANTRIQILEAQVNEFQKETDSAKNKIAVLEAQLSSPRIITIKSLRDRIFDACQELELFLDKYGPRPDSDSIPIGDRKEFFRRYSAEVQTWDTKFQADYWMNYKDKIVNLRHELALANQTDDALDQRLNEAQTTSLRPVTVREIDNGLRRLAAKL